MSLLKRLVEKRTHPSPSQPAEWFLNMFRQPTAAGVDVNHNTALQSMAVFACIRILAETSAMLPLLYYERLENGGKRRAIDQRLYEVLHRLPNPEMTSIELRETLMGHVGLLGNAYAEIEFGNDGHVRGLWPLRPDKTKPERRNGKLVYVVTLPIGKVGLPFERVMHIKGLGYDGVRGYDPIELARQSIGLTLGTEEFGARFYGNGAHLGSVLEHPGKLSDAAHSRLTKSVEMRHQGLSNAHRLMILEEGMKINSIGIPPENAQFLETRKFQISEIARLYRIPPHMLADLDKATFSNIEQLSLEFVTYTLLPWLTRWEQAIYRDLLTPTERQRYFAEHLIDGLVRGDQKTRYEAYAQARQNGWLSANDIREMENMNPVEGGDVYLVPLNMVPADQVSSGIGSRSQGDRETRAWPPEQRARAEQIALGRQRLAESYQRVLLDAAGRVLRREIADVRRAVRKFLGSRTEQEFLTWLDEFYEELRGVWGEQMRPVLMTYADQVGANVAAELGEDAAGAEDIRVFIDGYIDVLAAQQVSESANQLKALYRQAIIEGASISELIEQRLDEWGEKRAKKLAASESYNAMNAFTWSYYGEKNVRNIRWVARGQNCPYCTGMNGRVIGREMNFLDADTDFQPEGAEVPIRVRYKVKWPPMHRKCDCTIMADR